MCQFIYYWANDCLKKVKEDSSNNIKITFISLKIDVTAI